MVSSQFGLILKELESYFKCTLEPNHRNSCLIKMGIGLLLQIELSRGDHLLIGVRLGSLHMGKYLKELIRAALKSNELTSLKSGVFGFSHKSSQLILFMRIDTTKFTPHELRDLLPPFVAKAKMWHDAIAKNEIPVIAQEIKQPSGLFGLVS